MSLVICPNCGKENQINNKFCTQCGKGLKDQETTVQAHGSELPSSQESSPQNLRSFSGWESKLPAIIIFELLIVLLLLFIIV
jgi:uncharacterized membrane protein YvbJ